MERRKQIGRATAAVRIMLYAFPRRARRTIDALLGDIGFLLRLVDDLERENAQLRKSHNLSSQLRAIAADLKSDRSTATQKSQAIVECLHIADWLEVNDAGSLEHLKEPGE